jgi:hypothetical protein
VVSKVYIANDHATQRNNGRRSEQRRGVCLQAELCIFDGSGRRQRVSDALTRNSSFRGLALIARLDGPVQPGQALEVVLGTPDLLQEHRAGTVAFCRHLGGAYYEVGVNVMAGGLHSILADDMTGARARYRWFAGAIGRG